MAIAFMKHLFNLSHHQKTFKKQKAFEGRPLRTAGFFQMENKLKRTKTENWNEIHHYLSDVLSNYLRV